MSVSKLEVVFGDSMQINIIILTNIPTRFRNIKVGTTRHYVNWLGGVPLMVSSTFGKNAKYWLTQASNSLNSLLWGGKIFSMSKQEGLCNILVLSKTSLRKLSEGEGTPRCFTLKVVSATFLSVCFLSLKETNCETMFLQKKCFYSKLSYRSWENQNLEF